jgi:EmrB/QacA subfamily drug resistance transporter
MLNQSRAAQIIPWLVALALFMETLDATIISTAIPKIAHSLHTGPISLKIALTSYLVSLAIFIPISGWLADCYGTQKTFAFAIAVFTLGSIMCALSLNLDFLVFSRVIQGIGGALMMPVARLILFKTFSQKELVQVTSFSTIPSLLGPALGPVIGGAIVTYISWRWIFLINVPFGILGIFLVKKFVLNEQAEQKSRFDYRGFFMLSISLLLLVIGLESISDRFLNTTEITSIMCSGLIILIGYIRYAHKKHNAIVNLVLFQVRTFRLTVMGSFLSRCGMGGIPFLLPLFFQLGFGESPLHSGLLLVPYAFSMMMMKQAVKPILKRWGFRRTLIANTLFLSLTIAQFATLSWQTPLWLLTLMMCLHGLSTSLQFSCMNVLSYIDLPKNILSKGTSVGSCIQQLSMSFGIAFAAIFLRSLKELHHNPFHIQVQTFHETFLIMSLIPCLAVLAFMALKPNDGQEASQHHSLKKAHSSA